MKWNNKEWENMIDHDSGLHTAIKLFDHELSRKS